MKSIAKYLIYKTTFFFLNYTKERSIRSCYSNNSVGTDKKRGNLRKWYRTEKIIQV